MPGCFMAAVRHNRPTIIVYGGTIQPGIRHVECPEMGLKKGGTVNISDAFESYGRTRRCLTEDFYARKANVDDRCLFGRQDQR